jgi:hypothetical protein
MDTEIWLLLNCSFMTPTKQNKIGHLKIKKYKFERAETLKYLGVILIEDNSHQIDLQERIKNSNKTYFMLQKNIKNKNISEKLKLRLKNRQNVNICVRNLDTNKER